MPTLTEPSMTDDDIEDQISALEDFLKTLEPQPPATPVVKPDVPRPTGRQADLHRAKSLIDEAIALMAPHFPPLSRR